MMDIRCVDSLHLRREFHGEASSVTRLSGSSCPFLPLHGPFRVSLPSSFEAPSLRFPSTGRCRVHFSSSPPERSTCGCSSSAIKMSWGEGQKSVGDRRGWAQGVVSSPTAEYAHPSSGEEEEGKNLEHVEASNGQKFEWKSNWYPVTLEHDMDKSVPHPFQILGQKVVIWYDRNSAEWKTFTDVCPHRLAPLSEGRIDETGCLQCCYHGWSFGGDGSCTRIPQARGDGPEAKAVTKACATLFPTTVKQGILFIWPDANGEEKAQRTNPPVTPEHDMEGFEKVSTFRDMDYGWDTGMENLLDPSHVPVAHHNVNGGSLGTRDQATPINMDVRVTEAGCSGLWGKQGIPPQTLIFQAPARSTYTFAINGNVLGTTTTYVTPTAPGKCRVIIENGRKMWMSKVFVSGHEWWQIVPRWWDHQKMLNLLDGDESLLHGQERLFRQTIGDQVENWSKAFFMPTSADRYVSGFRQWLNRFGGKGVKWVEGVDPRLPPLIEKKEDLLDRYYSHTKNCSECRIALANFKLARTTLFIIAGLLVSGAPLLTVWQHRVPTILVAGISAILAWRIQVEWIPMFYYKGYDHARIP